MNIYRSPIFAEKLDMMSQDLKMYLNALGTTDSDNCLSEEEIQDLLNIRTLLKQTAQKLRSNEFDLKKI